LTNGNGLTLQYTTNRKRNKLSSLRVKARRAQVFGAILGVILIITPLFIYFMDVDNTPDRVIAIDGFFHDWEDTLIYTDTQWEVSNSNIDIMEFGLKRDNNNLFAYLRVGEDIFAGTNNEYMDSVRIFFDTDSKSETGYEVQNLGADYMFETNGANGVIHRHRVNKFHGTDGMDWHGWRGHASGEVSYNMDTMEIWLILPDDDVNVSDTIRASFHVTNNFNSEDFSDYVIDTNENGALQIRQQPLVEDIIRTSDDKVTTPLLELEVSAKGTDLTFDSNPMLLALSKDSTYTIEPAIPNILQEDITYKAKLSVATSSLEPNELFQLDICEYEFSDLTNVPVPISVTGEPVTGYVQSAPQKIIIDGVFTDWVNIKSSYDTANELSTDMNFDIDLREFKTAGFDDQLSFFMRVDGTMMQGTQVITKPMKIITPSSKPVDENDQNIDDTEELDPRLGVDAAYILFDIDPEKGYEVTEFKKQGIEVLANYMLELSGRDGEVVSAAFYKTTSSSSATGETIITWEQVSDVQISSATDLHRLETQVDITEISALLGIGKDVLANAKMYFMMTDWSDRYDVGIPINFFNYESGSGGEGRGSRAPPGGWPSTWSLGVIPLNDDIGGSNWIDIHTADISDSPDYLYIRINYQNNLGSTVSGLTYDFYFNVTNTSTQASWYRIRLIRNETNLGWEMYLNFTNTTLTTLPTDSSTWTQEEAYLNKSVNTFDGTGCGYDFDTLTSNSIYFWVNKNNLLLGRASLNYTNNSAMFTDSHLSNPKQAGQTDREADSGVSIYTSVGIPEYDLLIIPMFIIFLLLLVSRKKNRLSLQKMRGDVA
jgi:hypothetical protein